MMIIIRMLVSTLIHIFLLATWEDINSGGGGVVVVVLLTRGQQTSGKRWPNLKIIFSKKGTKINLFLILSC